LGCQYQRILVTRLKYIGDIVLTTPIIRSLRTACPQAFIAYLGERSAVSLLEHNPSLNEIIPFDYSRPSVLEQLRVARLLRGRNFDLVIDLFSNPRSALLSYVTGAPTRVGLQRRGRGRLYTVRVTPDAQPLTAVEFHHQFLRAVGIKPSHSDTEVFLTEAERLDAERWLLCLTEAQDVPPERVKFIGIHPGATWPAKRWLPERFAELADGLSRQTERHILVTAGPQEGDIVREIRRCARSKLHILENLPLRRLAAVIARCALFISNDAAPMHIAAAVGTPTIGLFGPGEEEIWFPYLRERGCVALRKDVPCHPCHLDICNRAGNGYMECMKLLTVEDVLEAAARLHL
jgi:lipopolysaccharide heptosyltransferase II